MGHIKHRGHRRNLAADIMALEPRMMFDGAAATDAAHAALTEAQQALIPDVAALTVVREADPSRNNGKTDVVFVDTSVADYQALEMAVKAGVAIVEIDGSQSGLAQMAKWAETHAGYDSIAIASHGTDAVLKVGTDIVNNEKLSDTTIQAELAQIGDALDHDGSILLYGCNIAEGGDGQSFINSISEITGGDVAASTNVTGIGGDWILEYNSDSGKPYQSVFYDSVNYFNDDLLSVGNGTLTIYSIWNVSQTATGIKFSFNIYNSSTNTDGPFTIKGQWGSQNEYTLITHFNSGWGDYTGRDWGVTWADLGGAPTGGAGTRYVSFYLYASGTGIPLTGLSYQESFGYNPNAAPAFVSSGTTNLTFASGATSHDIKSYLGVTDSDSSQTEIWTQSVAPNNGGSLLFTSATGTSGAGTISPTGSVTYTPNASFVGTETFTVQVSDGSATATKAFSVLVDDAPTVTAGGSTTYTERTPTVAAPGITVADSNGDSEWNNGTLAVNISANADSTDKLYLATSQPGSAGYWIDTASANAVKYWDGNTNTSIGTAAAAQVTGSSTWTITLNASATNALVQGLAQAILYDDNTHAPGTLARTIHFVATDKWGQSATADQTITISAINEAPTLSGMSNAVIWYQGVGAATLNSGAAIADVELDAANSGNGNYAGASVGIVNHAGANADDVISVANGSGYTVSGGNISAGGNVIATFAQSAGTFSLTFANNGTVPTKALVNDVLDHITYSRTSPPSTDGAQTVQLDWTFRDGNSGGQGSGGNLTSAGYSTVTLNRTPVVSSTQSTQTAVTGVAFTYQVPAGTFHDSDSDALTCSVQRVDASGNLVNGGAMPGWLSFDAGTRTFSGTSGAPDAGASYFKVTASDGHSSSTDTVRIDVYNGPSVTSIDRASGSTAYTNATSRTWDVTFNAAVGGVDLSDFALSSGAGTAAGAIGAATTAAGTIASVVNSGDDIHYTVTVNGIGGNGDLTLSLNGTGTGIQDRAYGKAITGGFTGQAYTIDNAAPTVTAVTIPSATNKVGDVVTAAITLGADSTNDTYYTLGSAKSVGGFTLGSLTRVDDTHMTATFTITDGGADVAAGGGRIPVNLVLMDRAGNASAAFTTDIVTTTGKIDANRPSNISATTTDINQNGNASAAIGTLSTTDQSSDTTFTYALVAGAGDTDNGRFTISGNSLSVNNQTLTAGASYSIRIRSTDVGGNTHEKAFTLRANTAPTSGATPTPAKGVQGVPYSFPLPLGAFTDTNGDTFTYTASNLPPGLTIDPNTGAIAGSPSGTGRFTTTITANDGHGGTTTQTVTFNFEAPPHSSPTTGGDGGGNGLGGIGGGIGSGTGTSLGGGGIGFGGGGLGSGGDNWGGGNGWGGSGSGGTGFFGGTGAGGFGFSGGGTGGGGTGSGFSGGLGASGGTGAGGTGAGGTGVGGTGFSGGLGTSGGTGTGTSGGTGIAGGTGVPGSGGAPSAGAGAGAGGGAPGAAAAKGDGAGTAAPAVAGSGTGGAAAGGSGVALVGDGKTATAPSAFQVAVAARASGGGADTLIVSSPVRDAVIPTGARIAVTIPAESFAHTKADAVVTLQASQANGAALPGWMNFNPQSGTFEGTPPPGFKGEVTVRVVARDNEGREAVQTFKIVVGESGQGRAEPGPGDGGRQGQGAAGQQGMLKPVGKPSLAQQLRNHSHQGRLAKQMALLGALKAGGKAA